MKKVKLLPVVLLFCFSTTLFAQYEYFVSNRVLNSINKYAEDGSFIEEYIEENAGGLGSPQEVFFHPDQFVLVSSSTSNNILKYDLETGDFIEVWNQDPVTNPTKMALGPDGLIYVTQWGQTQQTSYVLKFNLDGTLNEILTVTVPTPLGMGMIWDDDNNLYIALYGIGTGNGSIEKFAPDGTYLGTFVDDPALQNPTYIWWDTNDDMLVQDWTGNKIVRFDSDGNYVEDFATVIQPEGFGHLPNGNVIIVERGLDQVTEFDSSGTNLGQWDSGTSLNDPNLMAMRDTNLSVEEANSNTIMVTPSVGNQFKINSSIQSEFEILNVYNYAGVLVENIQLSEATIWNASRFAEGIYFIAAQSSNSTKRHVQKIIVKR